MGFSRSADKLRLSAALAASYLPYGGMLYATSGMSGLVGAGIGIAALYGALHTPGLKTFFARAAQGFAHAFIAKDRIAAPLAIQRMADDICRDAGMKPVPVFLFRGGQTDNAFAIVDRVYIGEALAQKMNAPELKFILAHELAHLRTRDFSTMYLSWPPYFNALLQVFTAAVIGGAGLAQGMLTGPQTAAIMGTGVAYYLFQSGLKNYISRVMERRADRNAMVLTRDFNAAASGMYKLGIISADMPEPGVLARFSTSHPLGPDRLANLKKAFDETSAPVPSERKNGSAKRHNAPSAPPSPV